MSFAPNTSGASSSNLFAQNPPKDGLFGGFSAQNNSTTFGLKTTTSGPTPTPTATSTNMEPPKLFGATASTEKNTGPSNSLFGQKAGATSLFPMSTNNSSQFNFAGPVASGNDKNPTTSSGSLFTGSQAPSSQLFGTSAAGAMTPAKTFSFGTSTTPAGPPPKENEINSKSGMFGSGKPQSEGSLFGGTGSGMTNMFGKGNSTLFNTTSSPEKTNISSSSQAPNLSVDKSSTTGTPSIFDGATLSGTTSALAPKTGNSDNTEKSQNPKPAIGSTFTPISTSEPSFSSNLASKLSEPTTTAPATIPSASTPQTSSQDAGATNQPSAAKASTAASSNVPPFSTSTIGPTPQLTRLKNKTMDEIITRWASDLSSYQKEFHEQAAKVAAWDRLMVENGEKIQKLYLSTFEAERQNAEIERQLDNVESQQDEVASWLEKYENEIDEMLARQVGQGETLQGPDQERERTYKLAEKLTDRLDEMGKNLAGMIDAINDASNTLTKTGNADDPLSSIVRVLNNHLTTLQWIDENAEALKSKVANAQSIGQSIGSNSYVGSGSISADHFYRSMTGQK